MKIGIVVPHIFMHRDILPQVIFSPASLALQLADGLVDLGHSVTLFTPGPVETHARSVTADLSLFEAELAARKYGYMELLKKHPLVFVSLARQVQTELLVRAFQAANNGDFDLIHVYTNEEDTALPVSDLCTAPVVFSHHDPFNFLTKYRSIFPKYSHKPWISFSEAQRAGMPATTHWLATIYHGVPEHQFAPVQQPTKDYIAYLGRIIEPKGVHLAIAAVHLYNSTHSSPLRLRIAGKHYSDTSKDTYWHEKILPHIDGDIITYDGFIGTTESKQQFLGNASALIIPSIFEEPFGMVMVEALACGTPVIGLRSGAIPEVITDGKTGILADKKVSRSQTAKDPKLDDSATAQNIAAALERITGIDRAACRREFESRFTTERMCRDYQKAYKKVLTE